MCEFVNNDTVFEDAVACDTLIPVNGELMEIQDIYNNSELCSYQDYRHNCENINTFSNQGYIYINCIISHISEKDIYRITTEHNSIDVISSQRIVVFADSDIVFLPAGMLDEGYFVMEMHDGEFRHTPIKCVENLGPSKHPVYGAAMCTHDSILNIYFANNILICGVDIPYIET